MGFWQAVAEELQELTPKTMIMLDLILWIEFSANGTVLLIKNLSKNLAQKTLPNSVVTALSESSIL